MCYWNKYSIWARPLTILLLCSSPSSSVGWPICLPPPLFCFPWRKNGGGSDDQLEMELCWADRGHFEGQKGKNRKIAKNSKNVFGDFWWVSGHKGLKICTVPYVTSIYTFVCLSFYVSCIDLIMWKWRQQEEEEQQQQQQHRPLQGLGFATDKNRTCCWFGRLGQTADHAKQFWAQWPYSIKVATNQDVGFIHKSAFK